MIIGITGGTGGLGKRLTEYLISKGHKIKVLVRNTSKVNELKAWGAELTYGDINDPDSLVMFIKGIDICYHLAAQVSSASKEQLFGVNVTGTKNICETILRHNPDCRLIYCSSIVVKGVHFYNKFFLSNYTMSKYKAEKIITEYLYNHRLKVSIIYPGYIYGPYDRNCIPTLINLLKHGLSFLVKGGERNAPVIYVDDLCELFYLTGTKENALGKKYISLKESDIGMHDFLKMIANKMNYPFPEKIYPKLPLVLAAFFLDKIYKLCNNKSKPKINMRLIGILSNRAKCFNGNALKDLGWDQRVTIPEGIDKAITWYMEDSSNI